MKRFVMIMMFLAAVVSVWGVGEDRDGGKKYVTVAPGKRYRAGGLHTFFFGAHWRKLWTTPVKVEVLDLETFAGGLTPHKRGGGFQTKSLRLKGKDGNIWKFRSIDKDPESVLPKELRDTIVESVLQDQISSGNPMAALVLAPILNAVGILQAEPRLVWMPDDERLGEFRKEFGGLLGTIEIHPKGKEDGAPGFEGARKVISSFDLFKRLENDRSEQVDAEEFLKARLVDIFVGDWDRHSDQWRWATYKKGKKKSWRPIPRDRDQAFSKLDGIFPALGEYVIIHLSGFRRNYPSAKHITWSGRFVDRRFLTELDKTTWDAVTAAVKDKLTDTVIEEAVKRLPPEHYQIAGREMISKLKHRRDTLPQISAAYYKRVNRVIDVFTGDKDDFVEVHRIDNRRTRVTVFKRGKKSEKKKGKPYYFKLADNRLTREIRIFLEGGNDQAEVTGETDTGPLVRIIGGGGRDELIDRSRVNGYFLDITPIPDAETKTVFYDSGDKTIFKKGPGTKVVRAKEPKPADDEEKYQSRQRNRDGELYAAPIFSFNSDDGAVVGGAAMLFKYNFRVRPYDYFLSLNASYASKTTSHQVNFKGIFHSLIKGAAVHLELIKTQLTFNDYYGFGNDTVYDGESAKADYYRTEEEFIIFRPSVHFNLFKHIPASFGVTYTYSEMDLDNVWLLKENPRFRYGLGNFQTLDLNASLAYDTRDKAANPRKGMFLELNGSYTPKFYDNRFHYFKFRFDTRCFVPLKIFIPVTLALRVGGEKLWGDYPFFNAAFLGGAGDLRGYNRKRFAGDAALFGQVELRADVGRLRFILPGRFGFHVFSDAGRVYQDGVSSDTLHSSYGGGIWFAFAKKMLNTSFTFAKSKEKTAVYFTLRMMY